MLRYVDICRKERKSSELQCLMLNAQCIVLQCESRGAKVKNNNNKKINGKDRTKPSSNRDSRRQLSKPEVSHTFTDTPA